MKAAYCSLAALLVAGSLLAQDDVILRAMKDELARSRQLRIVSLDAPYFIEYRVEDTVSTSIVATMGALVGSSETMHRIPKVRVRVGDYAFDNADHIFSDAYTGSRYDPDQMSTDNDYTALRQVLWLATDRAYKTAEEAIARKRATLKNINLTDQLPDFSKAPAETALQPIRRQPVNQAFWKDRVVKLSAIFSSYPQIAWSTVELQASQSTNYLLNSEGTALRTPEDAAFIRIRAYGFTPEGAEVRDGDEILAFDVNGLPPDAEIRRRATAVADDLTALTKAPRGEAYTGPVIFESQAAAQLFGQLLGDNLKVTRKPVADGQRRIPYTPSELENRMGARILPDFMDIVDDPTQSEWRGHTLLGSYQYDIEGVRARPLTLVEKGTLKSFLLTRTPVAKGMDGSNGRARMTGRFGTQSPGFGNLFVRANETVPLAELKKKLIGMCQQRNKPYGILIRKMDFPSTGSFEELRRMAGGGQGIGAIHLVSVPLLMYRVYPDGKEELIRGLRFRGLNTRAFKDIVAASNESYEFDFTDSNAPLALVGAGSYTATASVIAPGVLFDELELEPAENEVATPPIVPPPPLGPVKTETRD